MKRRLLPILFAFVFIVFWIMFRNPGGNPEPARPGGGGSPEYRRQAPEQQQPRAPQRVRPQGQRPPHPSGNGAQGWSMEEVETKKPKPPVKKEASGWSIDTDG